MTKLFIAYRPERYEVEEMLRRAHDFESELNSRRSIRHFSNREVPRELIEAEIRTASTAPSGAQRQPCKFVADSDPELKNRVRTAVEEEDTSAVASRLAPPVALPPRTCVRGYQMPWLRHYRDGSRAGT